MRKGNRKSAFWVTMRVCVYMLWWTQQWTHALGDPTTQITANSKAIKAWQMCVQMCECVVFLHLCVSQSLVVDLIQDDHTIRGYWLLPCDVHCILCHFGTDGTPDVISFVCGKQNHMVSWKIFLLKLISIKTALKYKLRCWGVLSVLTLSSVKQM